MILVDTNVLIRLTRAQDPQAGVARAAVQTLRGRGERLIVAPQNLYEFWAVATRPAGPPPAGRNGLGMTAAQAGQWLRFFRRRFTLLPDRADLCSIWQELVERQVVMGVRAHDVRLVATMQSYGITRLLTFNAADFQGFAVVVLDPAAV
ncbi:MAG: type II toxin-antitoxin system VapC family toxin [Planctomycetia bacterium]|nr:type II toxin-antitoxin system VapC family toxin [Planctomycetia bacterium]